MIQRSSFGVSLLLFTAAVVSAEKPDMPTECLSAYTWDQDVSGTNCRAAWYEWNLVCDKAKWDGEEDSECNAKHTAWQNAVSRTLTPVEPSSTCMEIPTDMDFSCWKSWYNFWGQCWDEEKQDSGKHYKWTESCDKIIDFMKRRSPVKEDGATGDCKDRSNVQLTQPSLTVGEINCSDIEDTQAYKDACGEWWDPFWSYSENSWWNHSDCDICDEVDKKRDAYDNAQAATNGKTRKVPENVSQACQDLSVQNLSYECFVEWEKLETQCWDEWHDGSRYNWQDNLEMCDKLMDFWKRGNTCSEIERDFGTWLQPLVPLALTLGIATLLV